MTTVTDVETLLGLKITKLPIGFGYQLHFLETVLPGIDFNLLGDVYYTTHATQRPEQQFFFISYRNSLVSQSSKDEQVVAHSLTKRIEQEFHESHLKVVDVALPKSHGFSGIRHNCRQMKELYGH